MQKGIARRRFLTIGILGGAGAAIRLSHAATQERQGPKIPICLALANHWSYIGIGWQLGLESCVLSMVDCMEMADRPPGVKASLNMDARAYELLAEKFPEVMERLKKYLAEGKVELIGGTFSQPLGSHIGSESNIRQIVLGREAIRKALGYEVTTFLEEEEFTHPQLPQLLVGAGFRYASLAQVDTWGKAGVPILELNAFHWKGTDGTTIPSTPKSPAFVRYQSGLARMPVTNGEGIEKLRKLGKPLVVTWAEYGWEEPETPTYLTAPEFYKRIPPQYEVEYVTFREYMEKYGRDPKETVYLKMDDWKKVLPWGIGGDQIRVLDRKVEGLLLAAETFDGIASLLGAKGSREDLESAWRSLLTAQSHDVALCEYTRWQGSRMAPFDRIEDYHNLTWGAIGYNHLDSAQRQGKAVLDAALGRIAGQVDTQAQGGGPLAAVVFNPCGWERSGMVTTGRFRPKIQRGGHLVVKDASGRVVPSQLIKGERDGSGRLIAADLAFLAESVPAVGYQTYHLDFVEAVPAAPGAGLEIDAERLEMENELVKIRLDSKHGAVVSLVDKKSGREMLRARECPFPAFKGRPNAQFLTQTFLTRRKWKTAAAVSAPLLFDSSASQANIRWIEKGPLRATVAAAHTWSVLRFETRISLRAGSPLVEVVSRVAAEVPPGIDPSDADGRHGLEIKEGYWLCFAPGFEPLSVIRDFPFAPEPTSKTRFEALTLVDLTDPVAGLLLLHDGAQYFRREDTGVFSTLLIREWESHWTGEYGWPRYAEYRHGLIPHGARFSNAERLRASAEFSRPLLAAMTDAHAGKLPRRNGFIRVEPAGVQLSAFRASEGGSFELRVAEVQGEQAAAAIDLGLPIRAAVETNLMGAKRADAAFEKGKLGFRCGPWQIRTFKLSG